MKDNNLMTIDYVDKLKVNSLELARLKNFSNEIIDALELFPIEIIKIDNTSN